VSDVIVTVAGPVTGIFPGGDLTLNDDGTDYRITMTSPKIVDVNGAQVSPDAIKIGESVQIIGTVRDKTITAQSVIVPAEPSSSTVASAG